MYNYIAMSSVQCWHDVESDYIHWTIYVIIYVQSNLSTLRGKPCNY